MKTEQPILITSIKFIDDSSPVRTLSKGMIVDSFGRIGYENNILGVANTDAEVNTLVPITVQGIALVLTGSAVRRGYFVKSNDNGKAIELDEYGEYRLGLALDASSGADEFIRVLIK